MGLFSTSDEAFLTQDQSIDHGTRPKGAYVMLRMNHSIVTSKTQHQAIHAYARTF